jgi:hypothetical protein
LRKLALAALLAGALVLAAVIPSVAAPNIYGTSGLIEVPDDIIYPVNTLSPAYHGVFNADNDNNSDSTINFFTVGLGILPNLDVSGGVKTDGDTDVIINAKYRLATETSDRPSITVGVIDAAAQFADDPGIFIVFGKNLTIAAEEISGGVSKPLRGYAGFGTGALSGFFLGLDWTLTPKVAAMVEFLTSDKAISDGTHFNAGLRFAISNELRVDVGTVDFSTLMAGISYNVIRF